LMVLPLGKRSNGDKRNSNKSRMIPTWRPLTAKI